MEFAELVADVEEGTPCDLDLKGGYLVEAADKAGIETEVCGEMASDPANKQHLQSLGIREVSVVWAMK